MTQDIDQLAINTIRTLSMDAVQKANSGHPGTPMSLAPVAYELWQNHLRYDPANPIWPNRDRFVLSAGHASMLLYSMIFLAGVRKVDADYNVPDEPACDLGEIESFRQLHSRTPGHPEYRWTTGVETTTGPLGQGVGTSVGMAMASKWLGATYGAELFDFDTYAVAGDGCLQEGISHEAASLAGHLKLDNLCWIFDNNHISIDGDTALAFSDDVLSRFEGYGWNVLRVGDANDAQTAGQSLQRVQGRGRPADADRRRQPHRLGLAEQAGHRVRPRRTARRRGDRTDEEGLRLAQGRQVPRPRRRPRALRRGDRQAWRRGPLRVGGEVQRLQEWQRREGRRAGDDAAARPARRLGRRPAQLRGRRREGPRDPQGLEQGPERDRREGAVADRRLLRPHRLDLGPAQRRRPVRAGQLRRPPGPLRDPRTRRRRGLQRDVDWRSCARSGRPTSPSPTTAAPRSGSRR